jgi:hypothetical protein
VKAIPGMTGTDFYQSVIIAVWTNNVVAFRGMDQLIPNLPKFVPHLWKTVMLPGCGHWTQPERPEEVNAALVDFLRACSAVTLRTDTSGRHSPQQSGLSRPLAHPPEFGPESPGSSAR